MAVVDVDTTCSGPFAGGKSFGRAGPYRRTDGVVTFAVDPDNRANSAIVDLDLAPRDGNGRVLFRSDFTLLAPESPTAATAASSWTSSTAAAGTA